MSVTVSLNETTVGVTVGSPAGGVVVGATSGDGVSVAVTNTPSSPPDYGVVNFNDTVTFNGAVHIADYGDWESYSSLTIYDANDIATVSLSTDGIATFAGAVNASGVALSGAGTSTVAGSLTVSGTLTGATFGGTVRPPAGSSSAPAFSFSSDTNTGLYSTGSDSLAVVTGGTQRIRVNSNGGVMIGSATATNAKLLVDSGSMPGAAQTETFQVLDSSTSGEYINLGRFNVNRSTARGAFMLSNSQGAAWQNNVMQFFVHGSAYANSYYRGDAGSDAGWAMIVTQGSNHSGLYIGTYDGGKPVAFGTAAQQRMIIDGEGNVGIGTDFPSARLHVVGNAIFDGVAFISAAEGADDPTDDTQVVLEKISNTQLKIKMMGSDSTVRSVTLTLS